ncbi:hypothetical protein F4Y93_05920 [Candidatus Poribacteria bacterium]|nr:hypothetical protein [Candidatus Poribacteria bacterium]
MEHRTIDFAGHSIPIVHASGIDWVAVRPILAYLYRDKDQTGELQRINQKYEVSLFNLPTAHGNRANQKCLHSGQLETWLYSFAHRRSHFKHPDGQFLSRVKHARELLPDLVFDSTVVVPEIETQVSLREEEPVDPPAEPTETSAPASKAVMPAATYTAFPIGSLTREIDNVLEATDMLIAMLTELKDALGALRASAFIMAENHSPE